ncbi:MAG: methyltransferase domain-containing protein [Pseudomonadales bacterium]|nr:methyltransferase domain-containing protein [Pseudomonadales bacterium]
MKISKYLNRNKAIEYARMSWPELGYNSSMEPFYSWVINLIKKINNPKEINSIVEIGFGAGRILYELSKQFPNVKIQGLEFSSDMKKISEQILISKDIFAITEDQKIIGKKLENINLKDGVDIQNLNEVKSNQFDLTVCINVLDRIVNPKKATKELLRITKIEGYCIIVNAFDYEEKTPLKMQIDPISFENLLNDLNFKILTQKKSKLVKSLPKKPIRIFNEYGYVLQKK